MRLIRNIVGVPRARRIAKPLVAALSIASMSLILTVPAAAFEWKAPTHLPTWTCDSGRDFRITSSKLNGDEIRFDETSDKETKVGWKVMPIWLLGTNFYDRRDRGDGKGVVTLDYNKQAFAGYRELNVGDSFKGTATETKEGKSRDWRVHITIDGHETISNSFLSNVKTAVVTDRRELANGKYSGVRTTWVAPEHGFVVRWLYRDHRGLQTCNVTALKEAGPS